MAAIAAGAMRRTCHIGCSRLFSAVYGIDHCCAVASFLNHVLFVGVFVADSEMGRHETAQSKLRRTGPVRRWAARVSPSYRRVFDGAIFIVTGDGVEMGFRAQRVLDWGHDRCRWRVSRQRLTPRCSAYLLSRHQIIRVMDPWSLVRR